ncbi:AAA family ATPase [Streptomyces sp. NBC_01669]|uniref:ATP-binding protein n=1 Tax=Streptomyces sp. NBC_01669 TaxID=2975909 RepID=UPI0022549457|nr:AAA family ATPase [Streptomyces sp. NBC_01669]MCX4536955.1 LuxR C-terminal-related transcriptional regulator [Streptomyces sp. NBC_01669]
MSFPTSPASDGRNHPADEDGARSAGRLVGRSAERALIDDLFDSAATRGAALVLTGEAGVGKSALLDTAAERASEAGFTVVRIAGSQFEQSGSFSGLTQLLQPLAEEIPALPTRQAETLQAVRGLSEEQPAELLAIANAVQVLLSQTAAKRGPITLVIDDSAWLDRPSAVVLGTVARNVRTGSLVLLAASRTGDESFLSSTGIPSYEVRALDEESAKALVAERFPAMTARVRQRLVTEAAGNPLALLELPVPLNEAQQTERGPLPAVLPLSERLKKIFSVRVSALPRATRELLLLAVLDGSGDLHILERAVDSSDVLTRLGPAERAGLVWVDSLTGRLVFRHPLTRSAVIELSTSAERRRMHLDLAEEFPEGSERRVRHLAAAAVGPDDQVAALLHDVAYRTLRRGDAVGAITSLLRASELSSSGTTKGRMLAEAACLGANITGDLRNVRSLLDNAMSADPVGADSLAAATAAASQLLNGEGDADTAHRLLVGAIRSHAQPGQTDDNILREALHTLLMVCFFSGRPDQWQAFDSAVAEVLRHSPDPLLRVLRGAFGDPAHAASSVLDVLDDLILGLTRETDPRRIVRTAIAGAYVDRLPSCRSALRRVVDDGRNGGAIATAIEAHFLLANDAYAGGQWDDVPDVIDEGLRWCATHNYRLLGWTGHFLRGLLSAARGDDQTALEIADRLDCWGNPRGLGALHVYASHIRALSALGSADFESAYRCLRSLSAPGRLPSHMPHSLWLFWDFAESAARTGHHAEAIEHVAAVRTSGIPSISPRLAMMTDAAGAIATPDVIDHDLFERAIAAPGAERWPFDWARICLAYGERLRRAKAGGAAGVHLEAALSTFQRLGAQPWCARAANELRASGVHVTTVTSTEDSRTPLTPQEAQIAQLAATGLTNKQIAAQLFLSPRTVAAHLRSVFPKLNVTSRAGLRDALTRSIASS